MKGVIKRQSRLTGLINSRAWMQLGLLKSLVHRDLEARYKGSVLGNFWPLISQLSQLIVYTYVFAVVLQVKLNLQGLPQNNFTFGMWLFAGLLPWMTFSNGLQQATNSVVNQPNLVKKVVFPLVLLPLVSVLSGFLESTLGLMALIILVGIVANTVHETLWLLPLVWLPQLLFTAGLAYFGAGLTVFLRDIPQTVAVLLNFWLYLTPICYPAGVIPQPWQQWVFWLNPMATIVEVYRDLVLVGKVEHGQQWLMTTVISGVVFAGGFWIYRKLRPAFADVL